MLYPTESDLRSRISSSIANVLHVDKQPEIPAASVRSEYSTACRYWLAHLVFVALTRQGAILLDLSRNRYLGIGPAEVQLLERIVEDWPARFPGAATPSDQFVIEGELIDWLLAGGIIRLGPKEPRAIPQTTIRLDGELVAVGDEIDSTASLRIGHVVCFFYSLIAISLALRLRPIASILQSIHARRTAAGLDGYTFDWKRASEFVSVFRRIRPYIFIAGGHCLLHALTLIRFLAHYSEFPQLVLGVKVDPWGAHSWVQHSNFLLDTNPEKVSGFTAILAV